MNPTDHTPEELVADPEVAVVMVTAAMWDTVQTSWRRTVRSLIFLVVATLLAAAVVAGVFAWRSYESQTRSECVTRTQAVGLGDLVEALKGAPTDPKRNAQLTEAAEELAKLRDIENTC